MGHQGPASRHAGEEDIGTYISAVLGPRPARCQRAIVRGGLKADEPLIQTFPNKMSIRYARHFRNAAYGMAFKAGRSMYRRAFGGRSLGNKKTYKKQYTKPRYQAKKYKSYTKTKYRRKTSPEHQEVQKSIGTKYFKKWIRACPRHLRKARTWKYNVVNSAEGINFEGQQGYNIFGTHGSLDQLYNTSSAPGINSAFDFNPFDQDPNRNVTGGGIVADAYNPTSSMILFKTVTSNMQVSNFSTCPCTVTAYLIMNKQNLNDTPTNVWLQAITELAMGQSASTQPITYAGIGTQVAGYPARTTYGNSPFSYNLFHRYYRKLKTYTFELGAGSTERISYTVQVNKVLSEAWLKEQNTVGTQGLAGVTMYWLLIWRPVPVELYEAGNAKSVTTTGMAKIAVVHNTQYTFTSAGQTKTALNRQAVGLVSESALTAGVAGNEKIINVVDGVISNTLLA